MKQATIISVNPGIKTLGELHINEHRLASISRNLSDTSHKTAGQLSIPDLIFGISRRTSSDFSSKMSFLRVVIGVVLTACCLLSYSGTFFPTSYNFILAFSGISIGFGFLTRISGMTISIITGYHALTSFATTTPDIAAAVFASLSLIFAVLGPGKYSCDFYLLNMLRKAMSQKKRNSSSETGFNYKAYNNIDSRLEC